MFSFRPPFSFKGCSIRATALRNARQIYARAYQFKSTVSNSSLIECWVIPILSWLVIWIFCFSSEKKKRTDLSRAQCFYFKNNNQIIIVGFFSHDNSRDECLLLKIIDMFFFQMIEYYWNWLSPYNYCLKLKWTNEWNRLNNGAVCRKQLQPK